MSEAGITAQVDERDIYALDDGERTVVMDAMIRDGADAPMVLVNGRIACTDGIDIEAVVAAACSESRCTAPNTAVRAKR
ncbi:MAG: hypothetical protein PF636_00885 [Actinomycetota bacterium]|nr:hypothetical protein [Actinomycetota bacterium]